jgi:hypothetical protein
MDNGNSVPIPRNLSPVTSAQAQLKATTRSSRSCRTIRLRCDPIDLGHQAL